MKAGAFFARNKVKILVPGFLLAFDLGTKYSALFALRGGRSISLPSGLSLGLLLNDSGSNAIMDRIGEGSASSFILLALLYSVLSVTALALNGIGAGRLAKAGSYIFLLAIYAFSAGAVASIHLAVAPWIVSTIRFAGGLFFGFTFLALTRRKACALAWGLFVAGGLGNFLCTLMPPFAVIDFINLPLLAGAGNLYFNLADLYVAAFWPSLFLAALLGKPVAGVIMRIRGRKGRLTAGDLIYEGEMRDQESAAAIPCPARVGPPDSC